MNLKRITAVIAIFALTFSLTACGGKTDYKKYKKEVGNLYNTIVSTDAVINSIDVTTPGSKDEFFNALAKLKEALTDFSQIDAPEEFDDCEYLSGEAVKFIDSAESNFHMALDNGYDDAYFQTAVSNYNQMVKCVNYMGDVLQDKDTDTQEIQEIELNQ